MVEGRGAVLLQGLEAMNRAVDGDTVAVEVLELARAPAEVMLILLLPLLLLPPLLLLLLLHLLQVVLEDEGFNPGDTLEAADTLLKQGREVQGGAGGDSLLLLLLLLLPSSSRWRAGWWGSCGGSSASTAACCSPSPCRAPTGTSSWPQRRKYLR